MDPQSPEPVRRSILGRALAAVLVLGALVYCCVAALVLYLLAAAI